MTQSLLHWASSPLGSLALSLWFSLAILALRQCQRWAKERSQEKVIDQNHPAIPVIVYDRSNHEPLEHMISQEEKIVTPSPPKEDSNRAHPSANIWDV